MSASVEASGDRMRAVRAARRKAARARLQPDIVRAFADSVMPPPRLTVSQSAELYRIMSSDSPEPGPWLTSRTPYAREPMDALAASDPSERVVLMWGAQLAKSEIALNWLLDTILNDPCTFLMVQPTDATAARFSKKRVAKMIANCPALFARVREAKGRDGGNTIQDKDFDGGSFSIVGSNAPANLASLSIRKAAIDETDRCATDAGGEGDSTELVDQRLSNHPDAKLLLMSTPVLRGHSRIESAYEESDQRKFYVPCAHCDHMQVLSFERLRWPDGKPDLVGYHCEKCDGRMVEAHKPRMLARGEWRARFPERKRTKGYWLSQLYSPWVTWSKVARKYIEAKRDPSLMQVFHNTRLAKSWDVHAETRVAHQDLIVLRIDLPMHDGAPIVPAQVAVLTCGVDVQHNRLEVVVYGWGPGESCWHIDQVIIHGDPSGDQVWLDLDAYLQREWISEVGEVLTLAATCVDTSYLTQRVYDFVRVRGHRSIFGVKGARGGEGRRVWPKKPSRSSYMKTEFYLVGADTAKAHLYARLKASVAVAKSNGIGSGLVKIAAHVGDESYLEQLVSEVPTVKPIHGHPRVIWELPEHKRNEALDCAVYGYAALHAWKAKGRRLPGASVAVPVAVAPSSPTPSPTEIGISISKTTNPGEHEIRSPTERTTPNRPPRPERPPRMRPEERPIAKRYDPPR